MPRRVRWRANILLKHSVKEKVMYLGTSKVSSIEQVRIQSE
jgi:hypothetical protein